MPNDIALRSQELTEQSAQRRSQGLMAQGQAWQTLPSIVQEYMQAHAQQQQQGIQLQQHQMDMMLGTSKLADDQLKRQQAAEELQWTQALHQTDMLGYQKEVARAHASLAIAQARKAEQDLVPHVESRDLTEDHMDYIIGDLGYTFDPGTGKLIEAPAEQRAAAKERQAHKESLIGARQLAVAEARGSAAKEIAEIRAQATRDAAIIRGQAQANRSVQFTAISRYYENIAHAYEMVDKAGTDVAKAQKWKDLINDLKKFAPQPPGDASPQQTAEERQAQFAAGLKEITDFLEERRRKKAEGK